MKGVNDKKIKSKAHLLSTYCAWRPFRAPRPAWGRAHCWVPAMAPLCLQDPESEYLLKSRGYVSACLTLVPALPAVSWLVSPGSQNTSCKVGGSQHKFILLQIWRLEVFSEGVTASLSLWRLKGRTHSLPFLASGGLRCSMTVVALLLLYPPSSHDPPLFLCASLPHLL